MLALEPTNYEDKVIGFDTFKGFTNINKKKDHNKVFKKRFFKHRLFIFKRTYLC